MSGDFYTNPDLYSAYLVRSLLNAHKKMEKMLLRERFGEHSGFIVLSDDDKVNADSDCKKAQFARGMTAIAVKIRNINTIYYSRTDRRMVVRVRGLFDATSSTVGSVAKGSKGGSNGSSSTFRIPKRINWARYTNDIESMMRVVLRDESFALPEDLFETDMRQEMVENNKIYTTEALFRLDSRNQQPILQRAWTKTVPPLREYETLNKYVVSSNVNGEDGEHVIRQLQTQLPDGFIHQPYDYDDMDLTEQWMLSFKMDGSKGRESGSENVITRKDVENCVISSHLDLMIVKVIDRVFNGQTRLTDPPLASTGGTLERQVFGMDSYTRKMVELAIEDRVSVGCYSRDRVVRFVERALLPAVNSAPVLDETCFDLSNALRRILKSDRSSPLDTVYATAVLDALADLPPGSLKLHSKGTGVICVAEGGVAPYTVVCDYLGELYPPYRWMERLDVIEQAQRRSGIKQSLPEFYNIILEKPSFDPNGFFLFYVDACDKGNVGSTLSHSCNPNCESSVVARNGVLSIALTSNRNIAPGEEITHDYHCVTTSASEYEAAICLCGMCSCRGSFLHLTVDEDIQQIINNRFGAVMRYAHLLRSCSGKPLTSLEEQILDRFGIKSATLGAHPPLWLRKIAAEYLKFIEYERQALPMALLRNEGNGRGRHSSVLKKKRDIAAEKFASVEIEARLTMENRIQSLVCCLSSINKVLTMQPESMRATTPVRLLPQVTAIGIICDYFADIERCLGEHLLPLIEGVVREKAGEGGGATAAVNSSSKKKGGSSSRNHAADKAVEDRVAKCRGLLLHAMAALRERCSPARRPKTIVEYQNLCNDVVAILATIKALELPGARLLMLIDVVILYKHTSNFSCFVEYEPYSSDPITLKPRDFSFESGSASGSRSGGRKAKAAAASRRAQPRRSEEGGEADCPSPAPSPAEGFEGCKHYDGDYIFWQILSFHRSGNFDDRASAIDLSGGVHLPLPSQCFGPCVAADSARVYGPRQHAVLIDYLRDEKSHSLPLPRGVRDYLSAPESQERVLALDSDGCAIKALFGSPILDNTLGLASSLRNVLEDLLPSSACRAFLGKQLNFDQQQLDKLLPPEDNCDWVQCCACHKWRRVRFDVDAAALPEVWDCSMNFWEATDGCAALEDSWDMDREAVMDVKASIRDDVQQGLLEIGAERDVFCSEMKVYYEAVVVEVRLPLDGQQLLDAAPSVKPPPRPKKGIPNFHPGKRKRKRVAAAAEAPRVGVPRIKFHFKGWEDEWDEWLWLDSPRIAPHHLYTNSQLTTPEEQERWQQRTA